MGDVSLGRYYKTPRMRVQMAENVNKALEFIKSRGVVLTNVGAEGEPPYIVRERALVGRGRAVMNEERTLKVSS